MDRAEAAPGLGRPEPRRAVGRTLDPRAAGAVFRAEKVRLEVPIHQLRRERGELRSRWHVPRALTLDEKPALGQRVAHGRRDLHRFGVEAFDAVRMLDRSVAESREARKIRADGIKLIPPRLPLDAIEQNV